MKENSNCECTEAQLNKTHPHVPENTAELNLNTIYYCQTRSCVECLLGAMKSERMYSFGKIPQIFSSTAVYAVLNNIMEYQLIHNYLISQKQKIIRILFSFFYSTNSFKCIYLK